MEPEESRSDTGDAAEHAGFMVVDGAELDAGARATLAALVASPGEPSAGPGTSAQRLWVWCHDRGVEGAEWTVDPLERRAVVGGLVELGARPVGWFDDPAGDRLLLRWDVRDPRVRQAADGRTAEPRIEGLRRAGAEVVLDVDARGAPVLSPTSAPRRLARIPEDVHALRTHDRDLAAAWAAALREAVGRPVQAGMRVTGITRDGWYVLAADPGGITEMA